MTLPHLALSVLSLSHTHTHVGGFFVLLPRNQVDAGLPTMLPTSFLTRVLFSPGMGVLQ